MLKENAEGSFIIDAKLFTLSQFVCQFEDKRIKNDLQWDMTLCQSYLVFKRFTDLNESVFQFRGPVIDVDLKYHGNIL